MAGETILVVEDEPKIVELLKLYLERDGFKVEVALDGAVALQMFRRNAPALTVLDINLPTVDGLEVCRQIRRESSLPIIMLTARDEEADKLIGLELGADDYVTKPFSPREVVARVRAVLRRASAPPLSQELLRAGELTLDAARHLVRRGERLLELTPTEFRLLEVLMRHPGRVYSRLQLLDQVQGEAFEGYERTVDAHVKNLRQKVEPDPQHPKLIQTVYGVGYRFAEDPRA
ncbi:MAG TPA: response regulator transcription factor [Chloroflexota bacterium]|nr:response regulator transcription factor [Chloroflexota bacterium]